MKKDNLYIGKDATDKLQNGITKIAHAVGSTMGTGGKNAIIEAIESPGHLMTNDGFTIASSIILADPIEDMGRKILLESINRANKASGDGSSTTCVLTSAIIREGRKYTDEYHPMEIKRSLEECIPIIETSIKEQKRDIDVDSVGTVATISAEDQEIGNTIQEIYKKIGKSGIIYWDISKTSKDTYTVGNGITVEGAGYFTPYMCDANENGQNTGQVRVKNAHILITRQKIVSAADFETIGYQLHSKDIKDLIVFCDEIDPLVVPDLVKTRMVRGFRFIVVKMPVLWKDWWYEDLQKATGATLIDPAAGLSLKQVDMKHLGLVSNVIVTKEDTYLDGIRDVSEYVKTLEENNDDDSKLRSARLNTKTARYFVGAQSDSALSYRRLKVEDAISAAYQALNGGIVAGGGTVLCNVIARMPNTIGGDILNKSLSEPTRWIYRNAGVRVPDDFLFSGTDKGGFDSRTKKEIGDMFEAGIVDPANIVLNACKNAISVAAAILTAPTIVTLPQEEVPNPVQGTVVQR